MASYVYVKNPNGTTYVYENVSYWDKMDKKTKHRRKCEGKLDPATKGIVPTGRKPGIQSDTLQKEGRCQVSTIGPTLLLEKAAAETGLAKALRQAFPEDDNSILSCAYYLASEGKALCHVEQWSARNLHPYRDKLPDQRVSELLRRISPSQQQDFFRKWADLNHDGGYFALDVTSVSSYSERIDFVRWGYNRDGDDLAQINVLMITSESTHLPVLHIPDQEPHLHGHPAPRCRSISSTAVWLFQIPDASVEIVSKGGLQPLLSTSKHCAARLSRLL